MMSFRERGHRRYTYPSNSSICWKITSLNSLASSIVSILFGASLGLFISRGRGGKGGSFRPPDWSGRGEVSSTGAGNASFAWDRNSEMFCTRREPRSQSRRCCKHTCSSLYFKISRSFAHCTLHPRSMPHPST